MTNAYLLCRIADTIEDRPALSAAATRGFCSVRGVMRGGGDAAPLAADRRGFGPTPCRPSANWW